jgi:hypothetical protein
VKTQSFVTSYGVHYDPKEYTFAAQYDNQVQALCDVLCACVLCVLYVAARVRVHDAKRVIRYYSCAAVGVLGRSSFTEPPYVLPACALVCCL